MDIPGFKLIEVIMGHGDYKGLRLPVLRIGYVCLDDPASADKSYVDFMLPGVEGVDLVMNLCEKFKNSEGKITENG